MADHEQMTGQAIETNGGSDPNGSEPKAEAGPTTTDIQGGHPRETLDPAERLPEEPEEQNDFA